MSVATILVAGGLQILGFATQTITIVYWTSAGGCIIPTQMIVGVTLSGMTLAAISQYGILLYANIFFPLG